LHKSVRANSIAAISRKFVWIGKPFSSGPSNQLVASGGPDTSVIVRIWN
jgi:hypothetical protein